jgi:hypothetical protein
VDVFKALGQISFMIRHEYSNLGSVTLYRITSLLSSGDRRRGHIRRHHILEVPPWKTAIYLRCMPSLTRGPQPHARFVVTMLWP